MLLPTINNVSGPDCASSQMELGEFADHQSLEAIFAYQQQVLLITENHPVRCVFDISQAPPRA